MGVDGKIGVLLGIEVVGYIDGIINVFVDLDWLVLLEGVGVFDGWGVGVCILFNVVLRVVVFNSVEILSGVWWIVFRVEVFDDIVFDERVLELFVDGEVVVFVGWVGIRVWNGFI